MKTESIMTATRSSTGRTAPFFLLHSEEFFYPIFFNIHKIFKKTHLEKGLIPRIDLFEFLTGIFRTFIAELYGVVEKTCTFFFQKRTFLIPRPTPGAVRHTNPFALHIMLYCKVPTAHVTVHTAGCNKLLSKRSHFFFTDTYEVESIILS